MTSKTADEESVPFLLVGCSSSELTDFDWRLQAGEARIVVRTLRGRKMRTTQGLFDEVSAAFQFPYYFGENWNALDECLTDLDWLPGHAYVAIIRDAIHVLADAPADEFGTFCRMLSRVALAWRAGEAEGAAWSRSPTPFSFVLHSHPGEEAALVHRYHAGGLSVGHRADFRASKLENHVWRSP